MLIMSAKIFRNLSSSVLAVQATVSLLGPDGAVITAPAFELAVVMRARPSACNCHLNIVCTTYCCSA